MGTKHHNKLTAQERDRIAILLASGYSIRAVARELKRSPSTICEEVRNNSFEGKYYVSIHAQAKADRRKFEARKRHPLKSAQTFKHVIGKLQKGWSPEIIAGRLNRKYKKTVICAETIYSFVYSNHPKAQELKLWEYLPRHKRRRTRKDGRKTKKVSIPGRISIHDRPAQVEKRQEVGHWEGDTLEGKGHKNGVFVNQERVSRKLFLNKILNINSGQAIKVQTRLFRRLPKDITKTVTFDNGKENHSHQDLHRLGISTFFCDPYSAWQKGGVENVISIVRRYLPKGTDITNITQQELKEIQEEINSRPRKILQYQTPNEIFNLHLRCSDTN